MDYMKYFQIASAVVPLIKAIIQVVEVFPNLSGADKKAHAMALLKQIFEGVQANAKIKEINGIGFDEIAPFVSMTIDAFVSMFNSVGLFTKSK